ncbi:MAG: carboxypeptidase-like regulatory domain-containing protein [Bacteroidota bacterium]
MRKGLTTFLIKFCALVVITCLSSNLSFAQSLISGTVTDASSGDPLVGASVVVKGTTNGTLTSDNGSFRISASQGDVLTISYVGYVSQEVTVTSATTYNVGMKLGTLDEVVITGYTAQSKANVSGAVAAVEVEELKTLPVGNVEAALQGRVAGVTVSTSGVPGSASLVRIRGFGTVNSNQPLYIIDGLPVQGGIIELNPNDIKEMTVLKDASAASYDLGGRMGPLKPPVRQVVPA